MTKKERSKYVLQTYHHVLESPLIGWELQHVTWPPMISLPTSSGHFVRHSVTREVELSNMLICQVRICWALLVNRSMQSTMPREPGQWGNMRIPFQSHKSHRKKETKKEKRDFWAWASNCCLWLTNQLTITSAISSMVREVSPPTVLSQSTAPLSCRGR
jgi:hypothetical protein